MQGTPMSRRRMLSTGLSTVAGLATPTIFTASSAAAFTNEPRGNSVTFGLNVPRSGAYRDEGRDQLFAFQLAVEHLNGGGDGGMLNTFSSTALSGRGVLGKKVRFVTGNTQTEASVARGTAQSMIQNDNVIMVTGGSSSDVAIAMQDVCQEAGVVFMAGLSHSNDTTGRDRKANGYRHFFNAFMSSLALAPYLEREYGSDRRAYHLTSGNSWGLTQEESMMFVTEDLLGWDTVDMVSTPLLETDFRKYLQPVINSGADILILNHYGENMVNSLTQAIEMGLRDLAPNGKNLEIVVPMFSRLMAAGAGEACAGIIGTTNWHWTLSNPGSLAFVRSFGTKYGFPPSQAAHTVYCQTLLYADAVQRAGSFHPCAVSEALSDFQFDGLGNGPTLYRAADHQCFKDVMVVRGKESPSSEFDLLEVLEVTPFSQVAYEPDHFLFSGGELGLCK